jgi:hypothetical protein
MVMIVKARGVEIGTNSDNTAEDLSFSDKPLWKGKYYLLLNEDFSVHKHAFIQVFLPKKPY